APDPSRGQYHPSRGHCWWLEGSRTIGRAARARRCFDVRRMLTPGAHDTEGTSKARGLRARLAAMTSDVTGARCDPLHEFVDIMRRLRAECAWKAEQTHESLLPFLREESAEVEEAVREGDDSHLCEELGDLLLQVVFHAVV